MTAATIIYRWDGDAMAPLPRFARLADRQFVVGQDYELVEHHERSDASHRHYFACIRDAWLNLPEEHSDRFASEAHLRKWALIRAGYRDERTIACASKAEALRFVAFMKPMDDYAVVVAREAVVVVWTAKSQSVKAMGKADFQASKEAVLGVLADLIGTDPASLSTNVREAA